MPGLTCGVSMSSTSEPRRPAMRMPSMSAADFRVIVMVFELSHRLWLTAGLAAISGQGHDGVGEGFPLLSPVGLRLTSRKAFAHPVMPAHGVLKDNIRVWGRAGHFGGSWHRRAIEARRCPRPER